ncbi:hypothetical protein PN836_007935 [Ningiella sp. W23]|uniref:hypothetical protein n=1 Tax=Ningiella sp. W23 TaxID=3023715 RepID=UPI003757FA5F
MLNDILNIRMYLPITRAYDAVQLFDRKTHSKNRQFSYIPIAYQYKAALIKMVMINEGIQAKTVVMPTKN